MGKDLKGRELGAGLSQRKSDKRYMARYMGKVRYADSLKEAKAVYLQLMDEVESHTYVERNKIALNEYFAKWLASRTDIKPSTKSNYKRFFLRIKPHLGKRRVQSVCNMDVKALQKALIAERRKPSTINSTMGLLVSLMRQAKADGIIAVNPCEGIKNVRQRREDRITYTLHRALTREEQAAFVEAAKSEWLGNMLLFMLCTGVRTGEARGLQWRDIDYKRGLIHIQHNISVDENAKCLLTTPKTETSFRDIPMTDGIRDILQRQRRQCIDAFGNVQQLDGFVFVSVRGNRLSGTAANIAVGRICAKLGIERITPHALRDTFATRAIEAGMKPNTLKTILGHANISMTMDLYAHVLPDTKAEEMERIASAF